MSTVQSNHRTLLDFQQQADVSAWIKAFLVDRQAQRLAAGSLRFYREKLEPFATFCREWGIVRLQQVTPTDVRAYLLWLEEAGHNAGGLHAAYRALRAMLNWWEQEVEPAGWANPIRKVKAPRVAQEPLEPADTAAIKAMLATCERGELTGARDRAALLFLMDTGVRAAEFVALDLEDCDLYGGAFLVRRGKGGKPRTVFIGRQTRQALRAYLKLRQDDCPAVWVTRDEERLGYYGLREIVRRRAARAGVQAPSLHGFRRLFALECLRNGMDVFALQRLMGHADLAVLRRYLAQTSADLAEAHRRTSPADRL
ncbi:MAG: tyrosine-type recombinase/integrase [Candidatus Promineifilaceae bacterium]